MASRRRLRRSVLLYAGRLCDAEIDYFLATRVRLYHHHYTGKSDYEGKNYNNSTIHTRVLSFLILDACFCNALEEGPLDGFLEFRFAIQAHYLMHHFAGAV